MLHSFSGNVKAEFIVAKRMGPCYNAVQMTTSRSEGGVSCMSEHKIVELFPEKQLLRRKRAAEVLRWILIAMAAAALTACIVLTARANTKNIQTMLAWCIGISIVTGWLIIYLYLFVVRQTKRELAHAANLTDGEREAITGKVTVTKRRFRIRNSVTVCQVLVDTGEGIRGAQVDVNRAAQLKKAGQYLTLYTAHGYVAAYEVRK